MENTGEKAAAFFTETLPTKWTDFWTGVGDFWTKEVPAWVESSATSAANFFTVTLPAKWTGFWSGVGDKISGFFTNARNAFSSGFSAGSFTTGGGTSGGGGGRATPHATGGIMTRPHVGLVAEDGPEAIIPLGSKRRGRGIELLHRAAAALGVSVPSGERYDVPQTPSNTVDTPAPKTPSSPVSGGLVSLDGREDDEAPEDVPAFSPVVSHTGAAGPGRAAAQPVSIPVEIGLNPQFVIQAPQA